MRRVITTGSSQPIKNVGLEDLKEIGFMADFLSQPPEPTISNEGMFDFFKNMFRSRISSHVNPYDIEYSSNDLDRVRNALRKTVLDTKWLASSKISTAKFPYAKYFQMLTSPTKPFDFSNPIAYISGGLKTQRQAFHKWNEFMEVRLTNIMKHHGKLQADWPAIDENDKHSKMIETLQLMLAEYPTSKEYSSIIAPNVTLGGTTAILPGKHFPSYTETAFKIENMPALTVDQLPEVANYVLELVDTLADTDTSYMDLTRIADKIMSDLPKSDQVLMWSYNKDRETFKAYAPVIYCETHYDWVPSHTWEFVVLRILLAWIMHSVGEKI